MGLFGFDKGISVEDLPTSAVAAIAQIISHNDRAVLRRVKACVDDPQAYFEKHADAFEERGIDEFEDAEPDGICLRA